MTKTETMLLAVHRSPVVPLSAICDQYFNCCIKVASNRAALNRLPVPAWKLLNSQKAPFMVRITDLAEYIDSQGDIERVRWKQSQI